MSETPTPVLSERAREWARTMDGHRTLGGSGSDTCTAHDPAVALVGTSGVLDRSARESGEDWVLAPSATHAEGAGDRLRAELGDPWRTCFERDRDRILHSSAFRRLAGKTQVFIFPADHQRTRLTHALEVAQVAGAIARACRLNVALTEAIALGHDCGHGPGGHASEEALSPFLPGGFDHAVWGAEVTSAPLNLCAETLDGIRNHSWSRPSPGTPEGEVVALADRMAYLAHDLEDAAHAGIVDPNELPLEVLERLGSSRSVQLDRLVTDVVTTTLREGLVSMTPGCGEALACLRRFAYERIYLRPASLRQSDSVVAMLAELVEFYLEHPSRLPIRPSPGGRELVRGELGLLVGAEDELTASTDPVRTCVGYVSGMTDRFACRQAVELLGWPEDRLPHAVGE